MADPVKHTPPPSPPSPTASYYDLSDEDEDEYNTIAHARSGRGVKLLFSKSKVYIPVGTSFASTNIWTGFCASYLLSQRQYPWIHCPHPTKACRAEVNEPNVTP